jgi:uncharacterized protein YpbB
MDGMNHMEMIILYCLQKLKGERTIYSVYHLLKGKRSSQTIQDAHLFKLTNLFQVYGFMDRKDVEATVAAAYEKGWVSPLSEQHYVITERGGKDLDRYLEANPLPVYLNGWKNHQLSDVFWERLSLLVQVVSNLIFQEHGYVPIQKNKESHLWLKTFLKNHRLGRNELGEQLYNELTDCFEQDKHINPNLLVVRLTGYNRIGMTSLQAAELLGLEFSRYHFEFQNVLHFLIRAVESERESFRILSSLTGDVVHSVALTQSTQKTYELFKRGHTIRQISKLRRLKTSTIEDHIVEIALNVKDFSINPFVGDALQLEIVEAAESSASKQLRFIRERIADASYFEIRLVLAAKYGDKQWN